MVSVSTRIYEYEHGKRPSGKGHWAFRIGDEDMVWFPSLEANQAILFTEAREMAVDYAKRIGFDGVIQLLS